jgi:TonB-dependent receptor
MFGETGFGVQANYTYVTSPLKYKNDQTTDQFAILGLSNSANLVGIYENYGWTVRLAYNWRDAFLASKLDGGGHLDPVYTAAYGQTDLSVGYAVTKNLNVLFEGINLTNSTQRQYGRTKAHFLNATQTGPRYMVGARYTF